MSIKDLTGGELAGLAEVAWPDSATSAGALFLMAVRDHVADPDCDNRTVGELETDAGALPHADHQLWLAYVDLALYSTGDEADGELANLDQPTDLAVRALTRVTERLTNVLESEIGA